MSGEEQKNQNQFTCENCTGTYELAKLGREWELYGGEFLRHCKTCFEVLSNPPLPEKPKKVNFRCDYCKFEIFGICNRRRVDVSMPNELGLKRGQTYNICQWCSSKVKEYNEYQDVIEGRKELDLWK